MQGPNEGGTPGHGGFVTFPAASFAIDPQNSGGYDRPQSRWVAVRYSAISPGGARFAYTVNPQSGGPNAGDVHAYTVSNGLELTTRVPGPVTVVGWTAGGLYVESVIPQSDAPPTGLTLIDPDAETFHQVTATGFWRLVSDSYAYTIDIDPSDPHPPVQNGPGIPPGDRVERMDLKTHTISPVLTVNGASLQLLGFDAGQNPIVGASSTTAYTVYLTTTKQAVFTGPLAQADGGANDPVEALGDSTGVWFSSQNGQIYHLGPGDPTAKLVASVGMSAPQLAGPCT